SFRNLTNLVCTVNVFKGMIASATSKRQIKWKDL
ncbi:hypothetical protein TNIN_212061, partial [Trichonephila inaurata madagascariensis]